MADGLLATQIGTIPFAHHAAYIDEVVTVEDARAARRAMRYLLDRLKIVAEPSGAITIAALQSRARDAARKDGRGAERRQHRVGRAAKRARAMDRARILIADEDFVLSRTLTWLLARPGLRRGGGARRARRDGPSQGARRPTS